MPNEVDRLQLRDQYVSEYLEKLFYFYLKKTGSADEAEGLASDTSLAILSAIEKGNTIENFSAWVWRIAKNRYAAWVAEKDRRRKSFYPDDVSEYDVPSEESLEDSLTHNEDLKLLRRELAFISSDYREIVVAYYIKQKRISEIAKALSIPEGTVKTKLYRARKILKEGLSMAREFGKRSYDPETISFSATGSQPSGLPWSAVQRKIPVNILCEANNNPCTAEELSIALGIALPYMEEEIGMLVESELLKKLDDGRYITNFFIYPAECQNETYEVLCRYCEDNCEKIWNLGRIAMDEAKRSGSVSTDTISEADATMYFAQDIHRSLLFKSGIENKEFNRHDGGNWGFCGFESDPVCRLDREYFSNNYAFSADDKPIWDGFQAVHNTKRFSDNLYSVPEGCPPSSCLTTMKLIADGVEESAMSKTDSNNLHLLLDQGFVIRAGGKLQIHAIVFKPEIEKAVFDTAVFNTEKYAHLIDATKLLISEVYTIVEKYINPYLKDDFDYAVSHMLYQTRLILTPLFKDRGLYTGSSAQFCALRIE